MALFGLLAGSASAQSFREPALGIGYVANAPDMLAGGTIWTVLPGLSGWGVYLDAKLGVTNPRNREGFLDDRTAAEVDPSHDLISTKERWWGMNAAVFRPVTPELSLYIGGGYSAQTTYREFWQPEGDLGRLGFYWVEDEAASGGGTNVLAGAMIRVSSRVRVQFGGESRPTGFTVGLSYVTGLR